jgi:MFS transporter, NNP family, nitrate/nitrite transporter
MSTDRGSSDGKPDQGHRPALMLGLATVGFAISFWARALLSPLAPGLR